MEHLEQPLAQRHLQCHAFGALLHRALQPAHTRGAGAAVKGWQARGVRMRVSAGVAIQAAMWHPCFTA